MVLDWEDALPAKEFRQAKRHSLLADLSLALGTSMRVQPAAEIPLLTVDKLRLPKRTKRVEGEDNSAEPAVDAYEEPLNFTPEEEALVRRNGALAIINLQSTPHDARAAVRVHGKTDRIMKELMRRLAIPIPDFVRRETYRLRVSAEGSLSFCTDVFGENCLFAERITVQIFDATNGALLQDLECAPRQSVQLSMERGRVLRVVGRVQLNANATLKEVRIECDSVTLGEAAERCVEVEVVRKSYPIAGNDDNEFLERDLPRDSPLPERAVKPRNGKKNGKKKKKKTSTLRGRGEDSSNYDDEDDGVDDGSDDEVERGRAKKRPEREAVEVKEEVKEPRIDDQEEARM